MKNKLIKVLAGLIIGVGLSGVEASASVEPGWHKHCQTSVNGYSWEYVNPDGSFASGWKYIDGYWYYFDEFDGGCYTGNCWYSNGELCGDIPSSYTMIDGVGYWFDNNGRLLTNTYVYSSRGVIYWLDESGYQHRV